MYVCLHCKCVLELFDAFIRNQNQNHKAKNENIKQQQQHHHHHIEYANYYMIQRNMAWICVHACFCASVFARNLSLALPLFGPLLHLLFGAPLSHGCHLINRHAHTYTRSRTAFMHARPHVLPLGCVNVKLRQHEIERNGEEKPLSTEGFCHRFGTDCK